MECRKCVNKKDCWIKACAEMRMRTTDNERDQQLVIDASLGHCHVFVDIDGYDPEDEEED